MHHACECPACRFKEFNDEMLKQRAETNKVLMLEAANILKVSEEPQVVALVAKLNLAARIS